MWKAIVRFFKSLFKKKVERREPDRVYVPPAPNPNEPTVKKIVIIVGHSTGDKGARAFTGESEFDFNSSIAQKAAHKLKGIHNVEILSRDPKLSYKRAMKELAQRVSKLKPALTLELHFNAFEKKAYGCEILVAEDANNFERTIRLADYWTDVLARRFNLIERRTVRFEDMTYGDGVKVLPVGHRGYWNLAYLADYGVPISMLIEPMFANIETDESRQFFTNTGREKYATFIADMLREF